MSGFSILANLSNILDSRPKIIGWGTRNLVSNYISRLPYELEYFVDNDATRHGMRIYGKDVYPPEMLRLENPDKALIAVFSSVAFDSIEMQARKMGFLAVHAGHLVDRLSNPAVKNLMRALSLIRATENPVKSRTSKDHAILIQGPLLEDVTPWVIRACKILNPGIPIILSTWRGGDLRILVGLNAYVDYTILSDIPKNSGYQNRNLLIHGVQQGIEFAQSMGFKWILKIRTDTMLTNESIANDIFLQMESNNAVQATMGGLKSRLLTTDIYTRLFVPYHPSDMIMAGTTSDMSLYWGVNSDNRMINLGDQFWQSMTLEKASAHGLFTETYLGGSFAARINWQMKYTLQDNFDFFKRLFYIINQRDLGVVWAKNMSPDDSLKNANRMLLTQDLLYSNLPNLMTEKLEPRNILFSDFQK